MSDVPELDKLIEENHNRRFNEQMRRSEMLFKYLIYFSFAFMGSATACFLNVFLGTLILFLSIIFFVKHREQIFVDSFKNKDMEKRYIYK